MRDAPSVFDGGLGFTVKHALNTQLKINIHVFVIDCISLWLFEVGEEEEEDGMPNYESNVLFEYISNFEQQDETIKYYVWTNVWSQYLYFYCNVYLVQNVLLL